MPYATYRFNKIIAAETIRFIVTVAIVVYKGLKLVVYRMLTFFERDSYFLSEGKNMLVDEFGKDYGIYFSILTLISQGKTTRSELENALNIKELSGYLKNLSEEYGLISKKQPLYERSVNKNVHYTIAYSGGYPFSISGDIRSVPS